MANIKPVTFENYGNKRWKRFSSYSFAAETTIVPLMLSEVRSASAVFPIAFVKRQTNCLPVAITGFDERSNVFVSADGNWLGTYIPAAFRAWPFSISYAESGEKLLCIDEDSGLINDGPEGEPFFNADQTPSEALQGVINFLARFTQDRDPSLAACTALEAAGVLEPWTATVRTSAREWRLDGFLRVNEKALNELRTQVLYSLHKAGALALAYAQLHAMANLPVVARLAEQRLLEQQDPQVPQAAS